MKRHNKISHYVYVYFSRCLTCEFRKFVLYQLSSTQDSYASYVHDWKCKLICLKMCTKYRQRNRLYPVTLLGGHFSFTADSTSLIWRKSCLYKPDLNNKFCPIEFYVNILLSFHILHPGSHSHSIPLSRFPTPNFFFFLFCVSKTYPTRFFKQWGRLPNYFTTVVKSSIYSHSTDIPRSAKQGQQWS